MSPNERSLLFYVLDALQSSPEQSREVLRLVEREGSSAQFKRHILTLQQAAGDEAVRRASQSIRSEIL
jgi:hypothetical protein